MKLFTGNLDRFKSKNSRMFDSFIFKINIRPSFEKKTFF